MSSSIEIGYPFKVQKRAQNEIYRVALKGCASRGEPTQTAARYNGKLRSAEILLHPNGETTEIRRAETRDDLFSCIADYYGA